MEIKITIEHYAREAQAGDIRIYSCKPAVYRTLFVKHFRVIAENNSCKRCFFGSLDHLKQILSATKEEITWCNKNIKYGLASEKKYYRETLLMYRLEKQALIKAIAMLEQ